MTKEETIKTLSDYVRRGVQSLESSIAEAFEQGQINPHWISVEDVLPPQDGRYIFYSVTMGVMESYYYAGLLLNEHVTHWMPLPEPPAKLSNLERNGKKWKEKKGGKQ